MSKYLQFSLIIILGLLIGIIIHGLIEIPAIWILVNWLGNLFSAISWPIWLLIHLIFTIICEVLGIVLIFRISKNWRL